MKKIIEQPVQNTGLVFEEPKYENYHATNLFGAVGEGFVGTDSPLDEPPIIFPDGKGWKQVALDYGKPEKQFNNNFDTFCCVIYSIAKATCYYLFKVYGIRITISEMYNAFYAGVIPNRGTTIEKGMESFRKKGWVSDEDYPFTPDMTIDQFFKAPPKTIQLKANGVLTEWEFHWEVLPKNLNAIFEAYKRTPVVLTGFAWASYYGEGVYFDNGNPANHAFLGLEPIDADVPDVLRNNLIDDTYPRNKFDNEIEKEDMFKELHSSFKYGSAHRCWITPKKESVNFFLKLKNMLKGLLWFHPDFGGDASVWIIKETKDKGKMRKKVEVSEENQAMWEAIFSVIDRNFGVKKTDWGELSQYQIVDKF